MNFLGKITKYLAVGFVLISALVMGYIVHELEITKQSVADQLIGKYSEIVSGDLDGFFDPIEYLIKTLKQQQRFQLINTEDLSSVNKRFIPIIEQYPQISSMGIADSRGHEIDILPDTVSHQWLNREVYVDKWGMIEKWYRWSARDSLSYLESWKSELIVDPRTREWFTGAQNERVENIYWSKPYKYMTGNLGLTASNRWVSNPVDTLTHILAIDITLDAVAELSKGLNTTENSQVFILTKESKRIIGFPSEGKEYNPKNMEEMYLSTPADFGNTPLIALTEFPINQIVSFKSENQTWWGVLESYSINNSQELLIAIMIPEIDFASDINSTKSAMFTGFIVILLLASLLVRSHNKLRKARISLNNQNEIIAIQNERLFVEVHHRVKNNLAIMAALMELENMESNDAAVKDVLTQTQRRVKSMSAVHEIMYKTNDVNKVEITEFIPGIINFSKKDFAETDIELKLIIDKILINVNQALTYALLLNEFMSSILKAQLDLDKSIIIEILQKNNKMITAVKISTDTDYLKNRKGIGKQLIQVLLAQLDADLNTEKKEEFLVYEISFELKDKKGITSNLNYN